MALPPADFDAIVAFVREKNIGFVVVGPEDPLVNGLVDRLDAEGIPSFGPSAKAAQLEGSKGFTKDLCAGWDIPTAAYGRFSDAAAAKAFIAEKGAPIVVKADGLAAGKGVIIAMTTGEADTAIDAILGGRFGAAGAEVVIEEFLEGEEASFFALCDGTHVLPLATAQDHKRVFDNDEGPNTGGMGAYSPAPVMTPGLSVRVMREIIEPTVAAMREKGMPFKGVLYAGLMITAEGPKLIEYNARFGDPECQVLMMRLDCDVLPLLMAAHDGTLGKASLRWKDEVALTVVMAAQGYPGDYRKNTEIRNLAEAGAEDGVENLPCRHEGRGRPHPLDRRPCAQRHRHGQDDGRSAGPRLPRRRPHRLARRFLPPRHRLPRHRARKAECVRGRGMTKRAHRSRLPTLPLREGQKIQAKRRILWGRGRGDGFNEIAID